MEKYIKKINWNIHKLPVVISIPHSGTKIPMNIKSKMLNNVILPNTDWYIAELYSFLEEMNYTILINHASRYVIDPNRDIKLVNRGDDYKNNLIYTKTTYGDNIYENSLKQFEKESRIIDYYYPYHKLLQEALEKKIDEFGYVYLLDLHSFGKENDCDFVLGNVNGKSSSNDLINFFIDKLKDVGYNIKCNAPYSGGYITKHYGMDIENCESLQIEIFYRTYIDDRKFTKEENPIINSEVFESTRKKLKQCFIDFQNYILANEI